MYANKKALFNPAAKQKSSDIDRVEEGYAAQFLPPQATVNRGRNFGKDTAPT
jgi:hypothetical protein